MIGIMRCTTMLSMMAAAVFLITFVAAELPDEFGVYRIQQKTECPSVFCAWNCERYIDSNGCLFCGKCKPKMGCPEVRCPNTPYFECFTSRGRDGCTICKCRVKPACPLTPMCASNCHIGLGPNGCERCVCPAPSNCPAELQETAICPQPDCRRERGPDGCFHCRCPNDVDVCPEVKCDPTKRCRHIVDSNTGCATGCQCSPNDI